MLAATYKQAVRPKRRKEERTDLGRLFFGTGEYACKILSISAGGAQVKLPHSIAIWATVTLVLDSIGALHCRVVWQRGDTVALQFVQNANWVAGKFLTAAS
jgi:hypothetical protein